jgi:hypothetical protein
LFLNPLKSSPESTNMSRGTRVRRWILEGKSFRSLCTSPLSPLRPPPSTSPSLNPLSPVGPRLSSSIVSTSTHFTLMSLSSYLISYHHCHTLSSVSYSTPVYSSRRPRRRSTSSSFNLVVVQPRSRRPSGCDGRWCWCGSWDWIYMSTHLHLSVI